MQNQQTSQDTSVARNLAAAVIIALLVVFVLQQMQFRFVVAAGR